MADTKMVTMAEDIAVILEGQTKVIEHENSITIKVRPTGGDKDYKIIIREDK